MVQVPKTKESSAPDGPIGPGSVMWRVMDHPLVFWVGVTRLGLRGMAVPAAAHAALEHSEFLNGTASGKRWQDSLWFFAAAPMGNETEFRKAIGMATGRHMRIKGPDDYSGFDYDLAVPYRNQDSLDTMRATHAELWGGFLQAYDTYVEKLTDDEKDQFFVEAAEIGAAMQIPRELLPLSKVEAEEFGRLLCAQQELSPNAVRVLRMLLTPAGNPLTNWVMAGSPATKIAGLAVAIPVASTFFTLAMPLIPPSALKTLRITWPSVLNPAVRLYGRGIARAVNRPVVRDRFEQFLGEEYHAIHVRARSRADEGAASGVAVVAS